MQGVCGLALIDMCLRILWTIVDYSDRHTYTQLAYLIIPWKTQCIEWDKGKQRGMLQYTTMTNHGTQDITRKVTLDDDRTHT